MTGAEQQSWAIDEREYARQESRRGRRYAYETLDPACTALVVVDTVVITGTVTSVCCESTARDAATLGHRVVFVADGTADVRDSVRNATLRTVHRSFGDVRPTAEVLALLA